jgi:hypothetical protein
VHLHRLADTHDPREFAEHVRGARRRRLKVLVGAAVQLTHRVLPDTVPGGLFVDDGDVRPVSFVLAEIAESLLRVEQDVLVPRVGNTLHGDGALLEADDLVARTVPVAARAEWNLRRDALAVLDLLQDPDVGIRRIGDRSTTIADDR